MRVTATARILAEAVDRRASCRFAGSVGEALGNILPLAVAVAVFPVPIIAVVLVLASERGTAKGLAFVLAWCVGLAAVGSSRLPPRSSSSVSRQARKPPSSPSSS